ncbi:MAG: type II toxin-antitoxin system PemK/MazF family toxin [Pseudomonadota bacterium]|nr:type II toxin-antitoxin system PemK/MazF family toxin [Pseudomonadota bacterium]MDE3038074.1 type II toxin-antitoxin system PemK/MazF family toxin [Pseudomonadota bacterium]
MIPFSTTPPGAEQPFHVRFEPAIYPFLHQHLPSWAKCNMINTVSCQRLDRVRIGKNYLSPRINDEDLSRIYKAMLTVFGQRLDKVR